MHRPCYWLLLRSGGLAYTRSAVDVFKAALERRIKNLRSNGVRRIEALASTLLAPWERGALKAAVLRYQLLTATAGAIEEARRRGMSRAVLLVQEFVRAETSDGNHEQNDMDLRAFVERLAGRPEDGVVEAALRGPFRFSRAPEVEFFIAKAVRRLRPCEF